MKDRTYLLKDNALLKLLPFQYRNNTQQAAIPAFP
jgi:hypothetical protein